MKNILKPWTPRPNLVNVTFNPFIVKNNIFYSDFICVQHQVGARWLRKPRFLRTVSNLVSPII